ncbi:MAG: M20 family metallopeptidase [Sphaerochaetaceae bacterium]|nr:M20 family metallopeptidase [Sphaerochaetaceae bacterium]
MNKDQQLNILLDILKINTVNGNNNERELAIYIHNKFEEYGIESEVSDVDEGRSNIIGRILGKNEEEKIIFNGHLDTVPFGNLEAWNSDPSIPFEEDGKIYSRGSSDMKSGLAAMLCSFCMISESKIKPSSTLIFLGTFDEEKNGDGAEAVLKSGIVDDATALIIGEPSYNKVGLAEKGCIWLKSNVRGKTSHSAYPEKGVNAIEVTFKLYEKLKGYVKQFNNELLGPATVSLNKIDGGVASNMVADSCVSLFDIRPVLPLNSEMLLHHLDEITDELKNEFIDCKMQFSLENDRRPLDVNKNEKYVQKFSDMVEVVTKRKVEYVGINFFSDGSILAKNDYSLPIFLFGPGNPELAHQPNENVEVLKYYQAIEIYFKFMQN